MASFIAQKIAGPYLKQYFKPGYKGPKIETFSGRVTVENMSFRPSALDFLNLPVEIKTGYVGKIVATINYSALMSSKSVKTPVSVLVEDVYIVVGPKTPREFNAEKYIEEMVKAKLSSLETWQTTVFPDDKEAQDAYGMVDKIVDNICVSVNRVHVRFESEDYAFGIALSSLGIHTTDSKWNDITPPPKPKCIYRKLTLSKLQLYLNTKDDLKDRHKMATMSILKDIYRDPADQKCAWVPLIPPISAELRVAMEKATEEKLSEADAPKPKTFAEIIFEPIGLTLSKTQYLNMLKMLEDISKTEALPDLPDYNEPAADADRDAYIAMYKRLFEDAKGGRAYKKVKKNETEAMETWEKKWAFADVVSFRYAAYEVAKLELAAEDPKLSNKTRDKRGGITGGLRSMFSSGPAVPELLNREDYLAVFDSKTEAEKKAEALLDRMKQLDPSYVATFAQVRFKQLFLALKDGKQPLVQYNIFNLDVQYKQRPVSMLAAVSIEKLEGIDLFSEDTRHKKFLRGSDAKEKLVSLAYETNPPVNPDKIDSRVRLQVGSLDVAIVMTVMNKFAAFFTPPTPVDLSKVREQAVARLADIQKNASARLAEAVKNRQKMELDVVVKAPSIIVPQDPSSSTCDVLVLDLGTLILRSRVAGGDVSDRKIDTETLIANANKQSDLTDAYRRGLFDSFSLQLKNFTLFLAEGGDRWRQRTAESKDKKLTILAPFSIPLDLDNAISPAVLTLPSINVNGRITKIAVHVSSRRMRKIMKIVEALTAADDDAEIPPASEAKAIAPPPKQSDEKSQPKKSENKSAGDAQSAESGGGDSKDKSGGDAKEAPAGPAPTADYRNTKINLSLGIEAVSLLITNDVVRRRPRDVLRLTIGQTKIFFRQREFDMRGGFAVQSIGVEDLLQTNGDAFRFIVSTNKDSSAMRELIRDLEAKTVSTGSGGRPGLERAPTRVVDYGKDSNFFAINFAAVSPEATDIYDNVNSTLNLNVGTLVVATNAETVPRMAHFFQYELMPPAKPKDPVAEIKELEALEAADAAEADGDDDNAAEEREKTRKELLNKALSTYNSEHEKAQNTAEEAKKEVFLTKVSATFESLQVVLCTRARVLARAKIDNFSAGFSDSAELKRASVSLDGIWVRDLTGAGVLYPYMVECTRGRKLIDINVVMQNKEIYRQSDVADIKSTYLSTRQKPKVDLNGSISGVKVTFLNRFVQELVAYPNAILADMAATAPPPTAVASAAPKTSAPSAKRKTKPSLLDSKQARENEEIKALPADDDNATIDIAEKIEKMRAEKDSKSAKKVEPLFDFYSVNLALAKIEVVVPQGSNSRNCMGITLKHVGITNALCEASGFPRPSLGSTSAVNTSTPAPPDISHQEKPTLASMRSGASYMSAQSGTTAGGDEFFDADEFKPTVYQRWQVEVHKLEACSYFDNPDEGITRDTPLPLFQIRQPEADAKGAAPLAARVVAVQNIPQNKLDNKIHPDLVVLTEVATISVIASRIQLQFLMELSSKNLSEKPIIMVQTDTPAPKSKLKRAPSADSDDDSDDDLLEELEEADAPAVESDASAAAEPGTTKQVAVLFNDLIVKLVEDPTAAVSRTLGLSWNIKADLNQAADGALSVRGSLRDVTIFNTRMNKGRAVGAQVRSLQSGHYIMQRFDLNLAANTGTSSILPGDSLLSARIDGGLVDLKLTYQDYKLVMDSVGFLNASDDDDSKAEKLKQSDSKSPLASIDEKRALTGADEKSPSSADSAAASKNKNSAALSPVSGVPVRSLRRLSKAQGGYLIDASALKSSFCGTHFALEEAKSFGEQSIVATFQGIKITLINNVAGVDVPFAKFDIGGLRATVDAFSHSRRVSANLNLEAMYFNQTLCAWEPMVEPWSARFDNWTTPGQDNVISLKADKPFYVNLTRGMLDSVTSSLELVTKVEAENKKAAEEKAGPSGSGDRYSSYMIRNDTDIPLKFKIGDHSKRDITGPSGFSARKDSDGTAPLLGDPPLLPGEESSLRYPQSMTQLDKRLVTVALKGYQQLPPFDLDNPQGAVEFSLESNRKGPSIGASEPLKVAVETRVVGGIRVVSVHSTVSVRNNTSIPLECSGVVVDPGARMFMPLRSGSAGVQIRPVDFPKQSKCTVSGRWDQDGKAFQPFSKNSAYATSVPVDIPELVSKMELSNAPEAKERNHRVAPHLTLTCAPRSYQLPIFNLTVVASQETTAAAREIKNENKNAAGAPPPTIVTLDLHPPLVLENALACEASFTISTKRDEDVEYDDDGTTVATRDDAAFAGMEGADGELASPLLDHGGSNGGRKQGITTTIRLRRTGVYEMYEVGGKDACTLRCQLNGYAKTWSPALHLPRTRKPVEMRGITVLSANSNSKLQVHCEVTQLQGARSGGVTCARRVAIFVPFWVYDATGLGLQLSPDYSTLVARPRRSNDTKNDMKSGLVPAQPELADWDLWAPAADNPSDRRVARSIPDEGTQSAWMFSCADPTGEDKPAPKVSIRATTPARSGWSEFVSLDSAENQVVTCEALTSAQDRKADPFYSTCEYAVGVVTRVGSGPFARTNMVTLCSRYVVVNNLEFPVEIRQHTYRGSVVVPPGTRAPYHFVHASGKRYCSMRIRANAESGASWDWSGSFQVAEPGDFGMSVRDLNSDAVFLARIEVRASDASLFIVIDREHPKCPPYRIINKTGYDRVRFCQTHVYKWLTVEPCSVCTYSWDQPLGVDGELSLSVEVTGDKKGARVYDLEELGSLDTITLTQPSQRQLFVYVFAEGPTKVLVLSDLPNPDVAFDPKASEEAQARALAAIKLLESVDVLDIQESRLKLVKDRVNTLRNDMRTIKRKIREIKKARRVPSDAKAPASASRSRSTLRVTLVEAASLSGVTWRGSADVFARIIFRGRAHETETLPSNLNPWFDHKFDLDATPMRAGMEVTDPGHPLNSTIKVALFSRSGIGSPDFLGGVIIRLGELAEYIVNEKQRRKKAKSKEMDGDGAGRVRFAAAAETPSADDEPVSVQRWFSLDGMRHLSKLQGRVNLKFEWFDSESDILRQTIHEKRAEAGRRARCQRVLYKAIRRERRLRGLADRKSRSVSRFSSRVGADAQVKRRIIKLEFLDAKLPALGDEAPPMGPEGSSIRFAGGAPSRDAAAARVVAVVTHGAHRRLASLYDPDPVARTLASQGFAEKMEFYIDEEDYKTESLRVDLFMVRPSTTKSPETYQRIGFCSLETAHANKGQKQPFIERATAFGAGGDENGVPEVTSSNPGTGTSDAKESEAGPEAETDGETETKTECVPMWIDLSLPGDMDEGKGVLAAPPAKERLQGGRILVKLSYSEAVKPEERAVMKASVALPEFGVSMIDSTPEELFFFQVKGLYLEYEDSPINSTAEVSVFSTQLDNCLSNAQFSTVLAPEAVAPDDRKPFLVIAFNQAKTAQGVPVTIFPYVSVLMQKLKLSIEERVLWRLWGYIQEFAAQQKDLLGMDDDESDGSEFVYLPVSDMYPLPPSSASKMFFNLLKLHPIAIDVSLELSSELRNQYSVGGTGGLGFNPLKWVGSAVGTAIDIDEAPLRLNPLTISEAYGSTATLVTPIVQHYTSQGIREAYKILGSLEILGNPVQLVGNLTEGFQDFFYEPAKGLVSSPQDFGRGLAKGTSSLLKHTLSGVFGSLSKVTGKVAEGVAVLGMDQEYQRKARMEARHPPKHIGEGLLQGGKAIFNGLFRGVTGLVTDPYHGCRRKGAKGFLQGVGTGLVGVGLKPAAGAIGAVSKILQGAGNTATLCDAQYDIEIARFPRYIGRDRVLRPYNKMDAEMAAKLNLYEITDMAIAEADRDEENYIMSIESPEGHLIVSSLRLLFLPRAAGSQKPKFSVIWEDTKSFQAVANNVLVVREGKRDPKQFKMASQADAVAAVDELLKLVPEFAEKRKRGSVAGVLGGAMRGATSVFKGAGSAVTGAVTGAFGKMFSSKKKTAEMKAAGAGSAEDVKITVTDVSVRSPDSKDKSMGSQSSGSKGALSL